MKFQLTFKTPDVLDQVLEDVDDDQERAEIQVCAARFLQWGEYIKVEFDTKEGTAKVIPCR